MKRLKKWLLNIRLWLNPSNVRIGGECRRCGACCRNLILTHKGRIIRDLEEFAALEEKYPEYGMFRLKEIRGDGDLVFGCDSLGADNCCSCYDSRPAFCAAYPSREMFRLQGQLPESCGYCIQEEFTFRDILDTR